MKGFIELTNEDVPKVLWCQVAKDYKKHDEEIFIDEKTIRVRSTDTRQLTHVVEIIKELGDRGYFVEEHYLVIPENESYP
ncbi:hypothetical protein [Methanobacterium sp. ACI-7]|uniref:hypothetical protein n=1 Tax=unclassified Methanobacterium TaxID=2627676 RepID=UPI0039C393F4